MPSLADIYTVTPENEIDLEDLKKIGSIWLKDNDEEREKFIRISRNSKVQKRNFILPYDEIISLNGLKQRADLFQYYGVKILTELINGILRINSQDPCDIGALILTSCSVPVIPSIDSKAILNAGLPNDITRVPIYQHGCAGGVAGIALADKLARNNKPVIVAAVELCSLMFQPANLSGTQLVAATIFADGAAGTLILPQEDGLRIVATQSFLVPNSVELMGYDILDDGFHLRLDRSLPNVIRDECSAVIRGFLSRYDKTPEHIDHWILHPGGVKILEFIREIFLLPKEKCRWSYEVLQDYGNLSSATVLYALNAFLRDVSLSIGDTVLLMGIGPGLTIETVLLEKRR